MYIVRHGGGRGWTIVHLSNKNSGVIHRILPRPPVHTAVHTTKPNFNTHMAKPGRKSNAGRKGLGKEHFVKDQMDKFSPIWWKIILEMLQSDSREDRRFALAELNKLQIKTLPNQLSGLDDKPIEIRWL